MRSSSATQLLLAAMLLSAAPAACRRPPPSPASAPISGPAARIGGPFRLTDQDGRVVDQRLLLGRWSVVYFGYTFCPDVCPATLTALAAAQSRIGADAKRLQIVFVTVDPARDTPAQLRAWLGGPSFPRGVIGLTGSSAEIAQVARQYGVYFRRAGAGRDYAVDHTSVLYLMNPAGGFDRPLPLGRSGDDRQPDPAGDARGLILRWRPRPRRPAPADVSWAVRLRGHRGLATRLAGLSAGPRRPMPRDRERGGPRGRNVSCCE